MIGGVGVWARGLFGCRPLPSDQQNAQTYHPTSGHMPLPPPSLFLALTPTAILPGSNGSRVGPRDWLPWIESNESVQQLCCDAARQLEYKIKFFSL